LTSSHRSDFVDPVLKTQELTKPKKISRFYKEVSIEESNTNFCVLLDGKKARTPKKKIIQFPLKPLAEAIAAEWDAQDKDIDPFSMPLNRLCNVALDIDEEAIVLLVDELLNFIQTDALIFRSYEPEALVALQDDQWNIIQEYAEDLLEGKITLTQGLSIPEQSDILSENARNILNALSIFELTALHTITTISGSIFIALTLFTQNISSDQAWQAGHLEEDWNISLWGDDEEAQKRRKFRRKEWDAACKLLKIFQS